MQLKSDNNNPSHTPSNGSSPYDDYRAPYIPKASNTIPDEYRTNNSNKFEESIKLNTGSRNVVFNFRSIILIGLVIIYIISMISCYSALSKNSDKIEARSPKVAEGYVKEVNSSKKQVTQDGGNIIITSTELVYTATYEFTVDGKKYRGEYDSLDKIELSSKINVVYMPENPADNHLQTAGESVTPHADTTSKKVFVLLIIGIVMAIVFYAIYRRTEILISGRW